MAKTSREWSELYNKFEGMYNPYPVQMSRAEAFGKAMKDGLITDEEYKKLLLDNGRVVLSNNSFNESFTGEVDIIDTYTYKKDYNIGDMVVVRNNYGISTIATISSVMESEDIENKYQVEPHFEY